VDDFGGRNSRGPSLVAIGQFFCALLFRASTTKPIKETTMTKLRLIALAMLFAVGTSIISAAEKVDIKIPPNTWWRITSGPGAGASLQGNGNIINDQDWGAVGQIYNGSECPCRHYHGTILGISDDNEGCGWGCVEEMRYTSDSALGDLRDEVSLIDLVSPGLADKLNEIIDAMDSAAASECYSVVEALADALEDEIYSYFGEFGESTAFDGFFSDLNEYVNLTEWEMPLGYTKIPEIKPLSVRLLKRVGSGTLSRLYDAGPRINARIGSVVSLEGYGMDVDLYKWEYKWKGAAMGVNPSGCYLSFVGNHMTAMSQKQTQVRVTVSGRGPGERFFKDSVIINYNRMNF